jgi:hypothetical protein
MVRFHPGSPLLAQIPASWLSFATRRTGDRTDSDSTVLDNGKTPRPFGALGKSRDGSACDGIRRCGADPKENNATDGSCAQPECQLTEVLVEGNHDPTIALRAREYPRIGYPDGRG